MRNQHWIMLLAGLLSFSAIAQEVPNQSPLTIAQIMAGEDFTGYSPNQISWSEDGQWIYFMWNPERDTLRRLYKVSPSGGAPEKVSEAEIKDLPGDGEYNRDHTFKVYEKHGDLFLLNLTDGTTRAITLTLERESAPRFSGDESGIVFERDDNLFRWDRTTGSFVQLTNFQKGNPRPEPSLSEQDKWLERDQMELFEVLRWREAVDKKEKARSESRQPDRPKPYYLGSKQLSNLRLSPDGQFATFRLTRRADAKNTVVPHFVTKSGYVEERHAREKVGAPQDQYELGICDLGRDTCYIVDTKQIEGIYEKPAFLKEYHADDPNWKDTYDQPREVIFHGPWFSENSEALLSVKAMDNKDRWLFLLDLPTGNLRLLDRQHDDAWIGGPGISGWNFSAGNLGWMPDNERVWFQSEATGFSHLYTVHVHTGERKALTSGNFEILSARISRDKQYFFITANKESPFEHHFYRMPVNGGKLEKITTRTGGHQVTLSPDESKLAVRFSDANHPWELFVMDNQPGAEMRPLTHSTTPEFEAYPWRHPEIIRFTARDGVAVPARIYRPDPSVKNGAAVIFVHGAGYLQNVHEWWSSYYREYMFHNILADNGYTVLDIDYRASNGYGRDWRTAIYRHMGGQDLDDQVDGARFLVEKEGIGADRIGIYGGSYGGFITLMALFNSPGTFKCGAALRSVTDWAHYNHPYTSNILNTPVEDSIAYRLSSPIYYAEGLQDHLLILHGMVDSNVHFQDVVRLSQRLIELGKTNWTLSVFPVESHGFVEPSSWTDEYRRIFKLFQTDLRE